MTKTLFSFAATRASDMALIVCCCLALLLLTTWMHYEALRSLKPVVARLSASGPRRVMVLMLGLYVVHGAEMLVYAGAYYLLARHTGTGGLGSAGPPTFDASLYFSFETYSSLGYGDIVPSGALRLMAGAEALNGLLLIGWSACYAHIAMARFLEHGERRSRRRLPTRAPTVRSRPKAPATPRRQSGGRDA